MSFERYARQILVPFVGEEGQRRIVASRVVLIGCGALGTAIANILARAGVGHLRIVDRDFVEESNLQRQVLFDEQDARECLPKAVAAERKLRGINSTIQIEGLVADVEPGNIEELVRGATVVVDGTDNFETRFLINEACVKLGLPWVYGGAVGSAGMSLTVLPGRTPCLRCVFDSAPEPGHTVTCETAGVLAGITGVIGSFEATEALKICAGRLEGVNTRLFSVDLWSGDVHQVEVGRAREAADCPCCKQRRFEYLEGAGASRAVTLCGRAAVQVKPAPGVTLDLGALAKALGNAPGVTVSNANPFLVRGQVPDAERPGEKLELTVFRDGRAIIKGTRKEATARAVYAKYVGA
jgi:molybdopterin/thiamine biosynthesis adenylyltransferase